MSSRRLCGAEVLREHPRTDFQVRVPDLLLVILRHAWSSYSGRSRRCLRVRGCQGEGDDRLVQPGAARMWSRLQQIGFGGFGSAAVAELWPIAYGACRGRGAPRRFHAQRVGER